MADKAVSKSKPQLRGLLQSQIKKNLIVSITLCFASGIVFNLLVNQPHKKVYADFYKQYDIEKAFQLIRKRGMFDSCPPGN